MSFKIKQKVSTTINYGSLVSGVPGVDEEVDVDIEVVSVTVNPAMATARYVAMINGVSSDLLKFDFPYSGDGNPIIEAELALLNSLSESNKG